MKSKLLATLLSLCIVFSLLPAVVLADGDTGSGTADDPYIVTSDTAEFLDGAVYKVTENVTNSKRIAVRGAATLILGEGTTLTATSGISVPSGKSLVIDGSGKLIATGSDGSAGIGGTAPASVGNWSQNGFSGSITINGGTISATGGDYAAGIGGGNCGDNGSVIISGGSVTAQGGYCGAGIGGGSNTYWGDSIGSGGSIRITGGTVKATGGSHGAGIGGGGSTALETPCGSGGNVVITGGKITATGGRDSSGIGLGYNDYGTMGNPGNIMLSCATEDDTIKASSYTGTVRIAEGHVLLIDSSTSFSGELTSEQVSQLSNQTLYAESFIIYFDTIVNGTVTASVTRATAGTLVTLTPTADMGYVLDSLSYKVGEESASTQILAEDGVFSFVMPNNYVTVSAVFAAPDYSTPYFSQASLLLSGSIGVKFYVDLSMYTDVSIRETTIVEFTVGEKTFTDIYDENDYKDGLYGFTCPVTSAQMDETITATLQYKGADGTVITYTDRYGMPVSATASVEKYCAYIAGHENQYSSEAVALAKAIADYGHYMTPYIQKYGTGVPSDKVVSIDAYHTYSLDDYGDTLSGITQIEKKDPYGILTNTSYKLYMGSESTLSFTLSAADGKQIEKPKLFMADETPFEGSVSTSNGTYTLKIRNLSAMQLDDIYVIKVTDAEGHEATIKACALSYAYTVMNLHANDAVCTSAMISLYYYCQAAQAYAASVS